MVECAAEDGSSTFGIQARDGGLLVVLLALLDHTGMAFSCGATRYGARNLTFQHCRISIVKRRRVL